MKSVAVITPTIAKPTVVDAIESVATQTYRDIDHVLVKDGPEVNLLRTILDVCLDDNERLFNLEQYKFKQVVLPFNTGGSGYYGHRIYAAFPHLLDHDYIAFLDEDNWYEPNHIESLVNTLEKNVEAEYAYSFRKIYRPDKTFVCLDECESLGKWKVWPVLNLQEYQYQPAFVHLIDTSSFMFRTPFLKQVSHLWHSKWGGDRNFYSKMRGVNHEPTLEHTLCYRLDGNPGSVTEEFFEKGNEAYLNHYAGYLPWKV